MRPHFKTLLIALVTVGLLAWFLRQANFGAVWHHIGSVNPLTLSSAIVMTLMTYMLRAYRWQYLLRPLGHARFGIAFRTTVIGFAANTLLPARVGEVLRPYLLARREHLNVSATIATIILERLLDAVTVLLFLAVFVLFFAGTIGSLDPKTFAALKFGGLLSAAVSVTALIVIALLARWPAQVATLVERLARVLPARFSEGIGRMTHAFIEGLAVCREPSRLIGALALSIPLWISICTQIWLVTVAFHMTIPYTGSFLIVALLAFGVMAPTPGAVGGFHEMFRIGAVSFYGVENDVAVAGAIVLHAVSFIPVTVLGAWFMFRDGLSFAGVRRISEEAAHEEELGSGASPVGAQTPPTASASQDNLPVGRRRGESIP